MAIAAQDWIGQTLCNRYVVRAKLGEGGMGAVLRAHDRRLGTDVVIKVPRRELLGSAEFVERFKEEIRALVKLTHPHVVKVTDADVHDGAPFAVLHFLAGGSLESKRRPRGNDGYAPVSPATLKSWLPQVATALDFLHKQNYVHRDVKPANILFDEHGNAYLGDFGVVKALAAHEEGRKGQTLTGTGLVLGTPQYMSPELIMGRPFDGRSDQYALAIVVYEMLCGRRPFEADAPSAILVLHTTKAPPPPSSLVRGISPALSQALLRGLAKKPSQRYASCEEFTKAVLAAVEGGLPPEAPPVVERRVAVGQPGRVPCPSCQNVLKLTSRYAGKLISCPHCRASLRVSEDLTQLTSNPDSAAIEAGQEASRRQETKGVAALPTPSQAAPSLRPQPTLRTSKSASSSISPLVWTAVGVAVGVLVVGTALLMMMRGGAPHEQTASSPQVEPTAPQTGGVSEQDGPMAPNDRMAGEPSGQGEAAAAKSPSGQAEESTARATENPALAEEPAPMPPSPPIRAPQSVDEPSLEPKAPVGAPPRMADETPDAEAVSAPEDTAPKDTAPVDAAPKRLPFGEEDSPRNQKEVRQRNKIQLGSGPALEFRRARYESLVELHRSLSSRAKPEIPLQDADDDGVVTLDRPGGSSRLGFASFDKLKLHGPTIVLDESQSPVLELHFKAGEATGAMGLFDHDGNLQLTGEFTVDRKGKTERSGVWCYFLEDEPALVQQFLAGNRKPVHLAMAQRVVENVELEGTPPQGVSLTEWRKRIDLKKTLDEQWSASSRLVEKRFDAVVDVVRNYQNNENSKKARQASQQRTRSRNQASGDKVRRNLDDHLKGRLPGN